MRRRWLLATTFGLVALTRPGLAGEGDHVPDQVRLFLERSIVVTGRGAAPTDRPLSAAQKELLAGRAAKVIALRELAELLGKVHISGATTVKDVTARDDEIRATVSEMVSGAKVVHESYDERKEMAEVDLQVSLDGPYGVAPSLLPKLLARQDAPRGPSYTPAASPPPPVNPVDGLIIDVTGKNFRPALINRIVTDNGSVLFEPRKVAPAILARKGCGDYTSDVGKAKAILGSQGAKNPMVVSASGVLGSTDAQVTGEDAAAIFSANEKASFLEAALVVFVL